MRALADQPRPVRIYYSIDSYIQDPKHVPAVRRAYESLHSLGVPLGFVTDRILARATPAEMKQGPMVVVAGATYVSDEAVDGLRRYAAGGGKVVFLGDGEPGKRRVRPPAQPHRPPEAATAPLRSGRNPGGRSCRRWRRWRGRSGLPGLSSARRRPAPGGPSAFGVFLRSARLDGG